ncbi:MAG: hypothetical protein WC310_03920 [Patescibacteria group bacterium]
MNGKLQKTTDLINSLPETIAELIPASIWRVLVNTWSMAAMVVFTYEFINAYPHPELTTNLAIIYIGVLTIYVGTKEFQRWNNIHSSVRYGEFYVLTWTILMLVFVAMAAYDKQLYVNHDLAATYIAILTIFALTREIKSLYLKRSGKK